MTYIISDEKIEIGKPTGIKIGDIEVRETDKKIKLSDITNVLNGSKLSFECSSKEHIIVNIDTHNAIANIYDILFELFVYKHGKVLITQIACKGEYILTIENTLDDNYAALVVKDEGQQIPNAYEVEKPKLRVALVNYTGLIRSYPDIFLSNIKKLIVDHYFLGTRARIACAV